MIARLVLMGLLVPTLTRCAPSPPQPPTGHYASPPGAEIALFPARTPGGQTLTIEAATDVSFSRAFILDFQRDHPDLTVRYVDMISSLLFEHARQACDRGLPTADLYLSVASDTLIKLANDGCARTLPKRIVQGAPAWAQWRRNVVAFTVEGAVFVYNQRALPSAQAPRDHLQVVEMLRRDPKRWRGRIGTYDIMLSEMGYLYANADARHTATYGRLIESFGRSDIKTYCCSNEMAEAVARGDIDFAYNVQMSYAHAARRAHPQLDIVIPSDYQAAQARSLMVPTGARNVEAATAFASYLVSPRGQQVASRQLAPINGASGQKGGGVSQLTPTSVGPALLAMGDAARRRSFIAEWRQATAAGQKAGGVGRPDSGSSSIAPVRQAGDR